MKALTLDEVAMCGYRGEPNPYLYPSSKWYALEIGVYLRSTGRSEPKDVRMSRGYSIWANGMLFKATGRSRFERAR